MFFVGRTSGGGNRGLKVIRKLDQNYVEERNNYIYGTHHLLSCAIPGDSVSDLADIPKVRRVRRLGGISV